MRSLPYDIPFKLSKRSKDVKDQFSSGCGGVDILGDALEAGVSVVQAGDGLDEVVEGSAEAVEPPDDQGVAVPDVVEGFVQPGALCLCSACGVGEDLGAAYLLQGILLIKGLVCG